MSSSPEPNPVVVFRGTAWQCGLVASLLENSEIRAHIFYGAEGTLAAWDVKGGLPINRVMVSSEDEAKAIEVVSQFEEAMKSNPPDTGPPDYDPNS